MKHVREGIERIMGRGKLPVRIQVVKSPLPYCIGGVFDGDVFVWDEVKRAYVSVRSKYLVMAYAVRAEWLTRYRPAPAEQLFLLDGVAA